MAFPQWPETINPLPLRDGYGFRPHEDILRSRIGGGAVYQRRLFGESDAFPRLTLPMTPAGYAVFQTFWNETLYAGARWFEMPVRFGAELATCVVRIPKYEPVFDDPDWLVTLELEVRDAPYLVEGGPYLAATMGDEALEAFTGGIHEFVHETWPGLFEEEA